MDHAGETMNDCRSEPYVHDANDHTPCVLAPPGAFSDEPAPRKWLDLLWPDHDPERTGPDSATVESRLFSTAYLQGHGSSPDPLRERVAEAMPAGGPGRVVWNSDQQRRPPTISPPRRFPTSDSH